MLRLVRWEEMLKDWQEEPHKLVFFIQDCIWKSGIKPSEPFGIDIAQGKVVFEGEQVRAEREKKMLEEYEKKVNLNGK